MALTSPDVESFQGDRLDLEFLETLTQESQVRRQLPGQPPATAYRYPLSKDQQSYFGAALKRDKGRFQGWKDVLDVLEEITESCVLSGNNKIIALSGLGGVGKTEILLEYGYQARQMSHIFFCQASPGENFESSIYSLASAIGSEVLTRVNLADREMIWTKYSKGERVKEFINWLQDSSVGKSLILFDDIDAFKDVQDLDDLAAALNRLPHTILLTTRDPNLGDSLAASAHKECVPRVIDAPTEEILESIMRQHITGRLIFSSAQLKSISRIVDRHIMAACRAIQFICQELSLSDSGNPVGRFVESFEDNRSDHSIREAFFNFRPRPGRSLADCFETTITRLMEPANKAQLILKFAACLMVPSLDFRTFFQHPRPWLSVLGPGDHMHALDIFQMSEMEFGQTLNKLVTTSAITRDEKGSLTVHPMMQEYLLHRQSHEGRISTLQQIMVLTRASIQMKDKESMFKLYAANCEVVARRFRIYTDDIEPPAAILNMIIEFSQMQDMSLRARELMKQKSRTLQAGTSQEMRQKYVEEAKGLWSDCVKMGIVLSSNTPPRNAKVSTARMNFYSALFKVVEGIDPEAEQQLRKLEERYSSYRDTLFMTGATPIATTEQQRLNFDKSGRSLGW